MQTSNLHRMRQSGWFDILIWVLAFALILLALGLAGGYMYQSTMDKVTPEMSSYEINQSIPFLAKIRSTLIFGSLLLLAVFAISFLWMRFVSPVVHADIRKQMALKQLRVGLQYFFAIAITLVMLFPIYWMIISSFKTSEELLLPVPTLWPKKFIFSNYPLALQKAPFGLYFYNTIVSTFFMMMGELIIGVLAAYGFSKGQFAGRDGLFLLVLGALMIPIQVTFVPIYVLISRLGWMNSFPGLIIPNLASAYFIFMLRQTFKAVDDSYLDAGRIDGMGRIATIAHVLVPMCAPTLITISIISFINGWNSYFWPR